MALSTRARIAGIGGALALGVLGATGIAYAGDGTATTPQYVTTVDDGTTQDGTRQAPSGEGRGAGGREDCPEGSGGGQQGDRGRGGTESPAPATPSASGSTDGAADA
jgi:hypothetical protein